VMISPGGSPWSREIHPWGPWRTLGPLCTWSRRGGCWPGSSWRCCTVRVEDSNEGVFMSKKSVDVLGESFSRFS
jgi:hypothetical protein